MNYSDIILADSPIGYWRLGETAGTVAADSSGNAHPGAYVGSYTLNAPSLLPGDANPALALAGSSKNGITIAGIAQPARMSVEGWVKLAATQAGNARLYACGATFDVMFTAVREILLYVNFVEGASGYLATGAILPVLTAAHIVATWDGTTVRVFVNGALVYTNATFAGRTLTGIGATTQLKAFGCIESTAGADLIGTIDECALYGYALSPAQIAAHYAMGSSYFSRILADAPVGYWRLGETAGTVAADSSGNAHPGTIAGGVTLNQPGAPGITDPAMVFNGITGYVDIGAPSALKVTGAFSVECWVRYTVFGNVRGLFTYADNALSGWGVFVHSGVGGIQFVGTTAAGGTLWNFASAGLFNDNQWHHVVATWDGTTAANGAKIYVDTVVVTQATAAAGVLGYPAGASARIADSLFASPNKFAGTLDEVALYGYALSPAQINAHYLLGVPSYAQRVLADYPTGYWRLGEPSGLSAADSSGNAHAGTISGGVTLGVAGTIAGDTGATFDGAAGTGQIALGTMPSPLVCSYEAWVKTTEVNNQSPILTNYNAGSAGFYFGKGVPVVGQGKLFVYAPIQGLTMYSVASIATGLWTHVVATYDGTTVRMYVNGVFDSAAVRTNHASDAFPWMIGRAPGQPGDGSFTGSLDEVAFYGYCLTAAQVAAHYQARALPFTAGSYSYQVVQDGASNYWRLNETSGATAVDIIGGKNGTITGGVTLNQPGALASGDKAMSFDGTTGYVTVPNAPALQLVGDLTIEVWCYLPTAAGRATLISKSASGEFELTVEATGALNFYNAASESVISSPGAVTFNKWHHLIVTRVASTKVIVQYVDGVAVKSGVYAGAVTASSNPVNIGRSAAAIQYSTGRLDEVALYPYALNAQQVAAHAAAKSRVAGIPWWTQIGSEVLLGSV